MTKTNWHLGSDRRETNARGLNWRVGAAGLALLVAACGGDDATTNTAETGSNVAEAAAVAPVSTPPIPAPAGQQWTDVISATPDGGFVMGNPDAPVKLVEYLSLTCSHCADFAKTGVPALRDSYVKNGHVSLEVRNFVRDPVDYSAALLARCGGPAAYFKLTEQLLGEQEAVLGRFQTMDQPTQQRIGALPSAQQFAALAEFGGLDQFVRLRGIPGEKAKACLLDPKAQQTLIDMRDKAVKDYELQGTPSFILNGKKIDGADWASLEPQIREAL